MAKDGPANGFYMSSRKVKSGIGRLKKMAKKAAAQGMDLTVDQKTGKLRMIPKDKTDA